MENNEYLKIAYNFRTVFTLLRVRLHEVFYPSNIVQRFLHQLFLARSKIYGTYRSYDQTLKFTKVEFGLDLSCILLHPK